MLLEINNLHKNFGKFHALRGISLAVREGEIVSVLGPSGCGKSTLLQMVAGIDQPDQGEIIIGGKTVATSRMMIAPEHRDVNMVFQDYALWPHMSVFDNIRYGLRRRKVNMDIQRGKVRELVKMLRLDGLEDRLPPQLSGGQQQRVAIARALATEPKLLLMDEPLSNLDMRLRIDMRTEMGYLFKRLGVTVLHVTHDPHEAFSLADRLLIMRSGQIDQLDTPQRCYAEPATKWAASLMGATNELQATMQGTANGQWIATVAGQRIMLSMPKGTSPQVGGQAVSVLFRPEDVSADAIADEHGAAHLETAAAMHAEAVPSCNVLQVTVTHLAFEGKSFRVLGRLPDGQTLTWLMQQPPKLQQTVHVSIPVQTTYGYCEEM